MKNNMVPPSAVSHSSSDRILSICERIRSLEECDTALGGTEMVGARRAACAHVSMLYIAGNAFFCLGTAMVFSELMLSEHLIITLVHSL